MTLNSQFIRRCLGFSAFLTIALMILNVYLSAEVSRDGLMIDTLSKKQTALKNDIVTLEQQYTGKTSLVDLSNKANELGYQKTTNVMSLTNSAPVVARN